jgi:hypothetical protein
MHARWSVYSSSSRGRLENGLRRVRLRAAERTERRPDPDHPLVAEIGVERLGDAVQKPGARRPVVHDSRGLACQELEEVRDRGRLGGGRRKHDGVEADLSEVVPEGGRDAILGRDEPVRFPRSGHQPRDLTEEQLHEGVGVPKPHHQHGPARQKDADQLQEQGVSPVPV